jgi:hypothetical protein
LAVGSLIGACSLLVRGYRALLGADDLPNSLEKLVEVVAGVPLDDIVETSILALTPSTTSVLFTASLVTGAKGRATAIDGGAVRDRVIAVLGRVRQIESGWLWGFPGREHHDSVVSMTGAPPDLDRIGTDELRRLLIEALGKVAGLTAENAALREEIARLKGLKGRPSIKPSGMASAPKPPTGRRQARWPR